MVHIYTMDYYSAGKKNDILQLSTTWMDLVGIMLSDISQRKKNTACYHFYVESKKIKQTSEHNKKERPTDTESKLMVTSGEREGARRGYKLLCMK